MATILFSIRNSLPGQDLDLSREQKLAAKVRDGEAAAAIAAAASAPKGERREAVKLGREVRQRFLDVTRGFIHGSSADAAASLVVQAMNDAVSAAGALADEGEAAASAVGRAVRAGRESRLAKVGSWNGKEARLRPDYGAASAVLAAAGLRRSLSAAEAAVRDAFRRDMSPERAERKFRKSITKAAEASSAAWVAAEDIVVFWEGLERAGKAEARARTDAAFAKRRRGESSRVERTVDAVADRISDRISDAIRKATEDVSPAELEAVARGIVRTIIDEAKRPTPPPPPPPAREADDEEAEDVSSGEGAPSIEEAIEGVIDPPPVPPRSKKRG